MSTSWPQRKAQLRTLLDCNGDDEEEGLALDRALHGQVALGKIQNRSQVANLRFSDKDLNSLGNLASGQFGTVELVNCKLDGRVYVRKLVTKKMALRSREQFSSQLEKQILLLALKDKTVWVPHMLCAYQCSTNLNIVMEYAEGGSLWDVIESSPNNGRISIQDLRWWIPQCVSAVHWCHSQGFAHRDIKPHNFVLKTDGHIMLIDFGSAAPLLSSRPNGVQLVPKQYCIVPCGTCDYISPEILKAHEEALVALEMTGNEDSFNGTYAGERRREGWREEGCDSDTEEGYGKETDWWSLGAMIYEMSYGVAPFFARDIRQTYSRIMGHETSLKFDHLVPIPSDLINLIKGFLRHHEDRLGRHSVSEIKTQPFFEGISWSSLHTQTAPSGLLLPQFTYTAPLSVQPNQTVDLSNSSSDSTRPFAFSAFLQSSFTMRSRSSPAASSVLATPALGRASLSRGAGSTQKGLSAFIGFSWGPPKDAFDDKRRVVPAEPLTKCATAAACAAVTPSPPFLGLADSKHPLVTPMRPALKNTGTLTAPSTIRIPTSVRRNTTLQRPVSDREAMKQLVDCVGMSARKRVLESGKKPRVLVPQFSLDLFGDGAGSGRSGRSRAGSLPITFAWSNDTPDNIQRGGPANGIGIGTGTGTVRKELRFGDDTTHRYSVSVSSRSALSRTFSGSSSSGNHSEGQSQYITYDGLNPHGYADADGLSDAATETDGSSDISSAVPPSPSPSPRPGSAMSMMSMSRRSATPTMSGSFPLPLLGTGMGSLLNRANSEPSVRFGSLRSRSGTATTPTLGTGTSSGTGASLSLLTPPAFGRESQDRVPLPPPTGTRQAPNAHSETHEDESESKEDPDRTPTVVGDEEDEEDESPEVGRRQPSPKSSAAPVLRSAFSREEHRDRRDDANTDSFASMHRRYDRLMADIARFRERLDVAQAQVGAARRETVHSGKA